MTLKIFSILDTKAGAFAQPFFMATTGQAIRAFTDLANDPQSMVNKHPADFRLFQLGEYDDQAGELHQLKQIIPLGFGTDFKRPDQQLQLIKTDDQVAS